MTATLIAIILLLLGSIGERAWRAHRLREEAQLAADQARVAEAETKRLRRLLDQSVARNTQAADAVDAVNADRAHLLAELGALADSLDQGAHMVAAGRIRRFVTDHATATAAVVDGAGSALVTEQAGGQAR